MLFKFTLFRLVASVAFPAEFTACRKRKRLWTVLFGNLTSRHASHEWELNATCQDTLSRPASTKGLFLSIQFRVQIFDKTHAAMSTSMSEPFFFFFLFFIYIVMYNL